MAGNLPIEPTPFIGRRHELADLRRLLAGTHVLTLIGTGGVGKTRLALALAADRRRAFPDGVWFIPVDGLDDATLLATHIAESLGRRHDIGTHDPAASLADTLRDQHLLLVLDNCEPVLDDVAHLVDTIVRNCPKVRIVATSRMPLGTMGDATYHVPPLSMPADDGTNRDLENCDAVRLFVDRARAVVPGFEITDDNRESIADLVRGLDGLPLALELVAVRLRSLTIAQIAQRLDGHRNLLDWGSRTAPARHQTMRASLQLSADLCTPDERRLWGRLSDFRGTFDLDAVEAVCDDGAFDTDILDLVQGLVERSIMVREDHGPVVRYSMLTAIRDFGRELLDDDHARRELRERHTAWYLGLAKRAEAEWNSECQLHWLRVLPADHRNIVHALGAACDDAASAEQAATAICALWRYYWWACGWQTEGVYWVRRCLPQLADSVPRARLLLIGSLLAWTTGDIGPGSDWLTEGQVLGEQFNDPLSLALAEHVAGDAAFYRGRHHDAVDNFRRALAIYPADAASFRVDTLLMLTLVCGMRGDVADAENAHLESLFTLDPAERFQRSYSMLYVAAALRVHGPTDQALHAARDALRLKADIDDPFGIAWSLEIIAEILCDQGKYERSAVLVGAADRLWTAMSIDGATRERLQIHDRQVRERVHAAAGPAALADHTRRGEQLGTADAVAAALHEGAAARPASTPATTLTARESQVAELVAHGLTNKQIAAKLVISQRTAEGHVQNILQKLGYATRSQIAAWSASHADGPI